MELDNSVINILIPLLGGYVLDLIFGDPQWFPHPVKGFGWLITKGEKHLNQKKYRFLKGSTMTITLILLSFAIVYFLQKIAFTTNIYLGWVFESILIYFCLANKNLIDEGKAVFDALKTDLNEGRKRLSWIVGRDTSSLTPNQIRIATFETMAENLSDGVVAPLFFYAIGGIPAMVAYKMINTLDSMIGYKNERFEYFGKFAARCDDVANYLPARITAFLISMVTLSKRSIYFIFQYGNKHKSPNSGYPEAAMAGYLNCRFGGPNYYNGILVDKPYIGKNDRIIEPRELKKVIRTNHSVTFIAIVIILFLFLKN